MFLLLNWASLREPHTYHIILLGKILCLYVRTYIYYGSYACMLRSFIRRIILTPHEYYMILPALSISAASEHMAYLIVTIFYRT